MMPQLTPQAYKIVDEEYDIKRGYAAQRESCRVMFQRASLLIETDLNPVGIIQRPVFKAEECAEICEKFENGLADQFDRDYAVELLKRIITPEIDAEILSYFESEYAPIKSGFLVAQANENLDVSDGWHCDAGPSKFLRIMGFFTGSEKDGANTLFCDRRTTEELREVGYVFCELRNRVMDLDPVTDAYGFDKATVLEFKIEPGDVIVFDAPNILHRRLIPKLGPRYVFTATLIPSLLSWHQVTDMGALPMSLEYESFPPMPGFAREDVGQRI